ncbi:MAG: hypothetical protein GWO24_28085, partial [Akkermansiaceae bacterium]|nr:hypothetical protein [Akkermansiaceae bacterium]
MRDNLKRIYRRTVPDALAGPINSLYKRFRNPNPRVPVHEAQVIDEVGAIFVH